MEAPTVASYVCSVTISSLPKLFIIVSQLFILLDYKLCVCFFFKVWYLMYMYVAYENTWRIRESLAIICTYTAHNDIITCCSFYCYSLLLVL